MFEAFLLLILVSVFIVFPLLTWIDINRNRHD